MKRFAALLVLAWLFLATPAQAAITCSSVASSGWTYYYVNGTTAGQQLSYTVTCNRSATSDPLTFSYSNNVNNGLRGDKAQLTVGATNYRLSYNLFQTSCTGTIWANKAATNIDGVITWGASETGVKTDTQYYWACINTGQTATAEGWYTDTVTMTLKGTGVNITGTIPINIYAPSSCVINSGPGAFNLSYTSFQSTALVAAQALTNTCSNGMSYTFSVSPTGGTINGIVYTVDITATGAAGSAVTTTLGTGSVQTFYARVTAASGQAGTCNAASCPGTAVTHTLTITY